MFQAKLKRMALGLAVVVVLGSGIAVGVLNNTEIVSAEKPSFGDNIHKKSHKKSGHGDIVVKLSAAVESGRLTQAEADAKLEGLIDKKKRPDLSKKYSQGNIAQKLSAAVESGRLTRAEADAKLQQISSDGSNQRKRINPSVLREKLASAVAAGKLTQAESNEKWESFKDLLRMRIEEAVASGRITRAVADLKLAEIE